MFTPHQDHHKSETFLHHFGVYLIARLLADLEVKMIAPLMEKAQAALKSAYDAAVAAVVEQEKARAVLDTAAFHLLRDVREFELALLARVRKNRKSEDYRRFFRDGLSEFRVAPLDDQLRWVEAMGRQLAEGAGPAEPGPWAARLAGHRKAAEAALAGNRRAIDLRAEAQGAEVRARVAWTEAYRATYGELIRRFPRDEERVESYFRVRPHARKKAVADKPAAGAQPKPDRTS